MGVFQQYAVMGIDLARSAHRSKRAGVPPFIGIGQRATVGICRSLPRPPVPGGNTHPV
jgi:hypothetical protein